MHMGRFLIRSSLALIFFALIGCGREKKSDVVADNAPLSECGKGSVPPSPMAAGQLILSVPPNVDPCSVTGYIVGLKDQLKLRSAEGGKYFIDNVPGGVHDIVIEAESLETKLLDQEKDKDRGIRLSKVKFLNGVKTERGRVDVPKFGSVSGSVKLVNQTDHSGVDVYIPGTDVIAKTDGNGNFSFTDIPVGLHNFYFEKDGYHRGQLEAIQVESEKSTTLTSVDLVISTGAEGFLLIEGGKKSFDSRNVRLTVGATPDAVLMKISESQTFEGAGWRPLSTTTDYVFSTPGEKTLFVKFANANALESSPFRAEILVNLFEGIQTVILSKNPLVTPPSEPTFLLDVPNFPKNAVKAEVSLSSNFSDSKAITNIGSFSYTLPASHESCGTRKLYTRFVDKDGFYSPPFATDVELRCWSSISRLNGPNLRMFSQNYGPAFATFGNKVFFLEPGIDSSKKAAYSYDSVADSWSSLANAPLALMGATASWTGERMLVWGGYVNGDPFSLNQSILEYNPGSNTWQTITPTNTIAGRVSAASVWTGTKMFVWGGDQSQGSPGARNDGGMYDPQTNTWASISTTNAPTARTGRPTIAWTGSKVLIWGGWSWGNGGGFSSGGSYDPLNDAWHPIQDSPHVGGQGGAWTGTKLVAASFDGGGSEAGLSFMEFNPIGNTWETSNWNMLKFLQGGQHVVSWVNGQLLMISWDSAVLVNPAAYK